MVGGVQGNPAGGTDAVVTPLEAIEAVLQEAGSTTTVSLTQGCWIIGEGSWMFPDALAAAKAADVVVLLLGS